MFSGQLLLMQFVCCWCRVVYATRHLIISIVYYYLFILSICLVVWGFTIQLIPYHFHMISPISRAVKFTKVHALPRSKYKPSIINNQCLRVANGTCFPIAAGEYIQERIPESKLVAFKNSSHLLFLEETEKFNRELDTFFNA